jgi:2-iminobutanoate/2-iminopropanoate deaminase
VSRLLRHGSVVTLFLLVSAFGTQLFCQTGGVLKVIKVEGRNTRQASSAGVLAGETLYVAGQDGRTSDGNLPNDLQQEVSQSLRNVQGVLRAAGMDFGNVVWMHIYLTNAQDMAGMNEAYWKSIGAHPPARTVLVVGGLPNGEKVEITDPALNEETISRCGSSHCLWREATDGSCRPQP